MNGISGSTTTTAYNLPTEAVGYAQSYLERAYQLSTNPAYDSIFGDYTDPTYADFQYLDGHYPETEGIVALASRGANGNTTVKKGRWLIEDIIAGKYLDGANFLSNDGVTNHTEFQAMIGDVAAKPTTTFDNDIKTKVGATLYLIGDLSAENLAFDLTAVLAARYVDRATAEMYHQNYQSEKNKQLQVVPAGVVYAMEPAKDAEMLHRAGLKYRVWLQGKYKTNYELWQDEQTAGLRRTEVLGNAIRSLVGSQTTRTEPYHRPSPLMGAAAGAMAGASMGSAVPGIGTVAGAVIGGALGYLGSQ